MKILNLVYHECGPAILLLFCVEGQTNGGKSDGIRSQQRKYKNAALLGLLHVCGQFMCVDNVSVAFVQHSGHNCSSSCNNSSYVDLQRSNHCHLCATGRAHEYLSALVVEILYF